MRVGLPTLQSDVHCHSPNPHLVRLIWIKVFLLLLTTILIKYNFDTHTNIYCLRSRTQHNNSNNNKFIQPTKHKHDAHFAYPYFVSDEPAATADCQHQIMDDGCTLPQPILSTIWVGGIMAIYHQHGTCYLPAVPIMQSNTLSCWSYGIIQYLVWRKLGWLFDPHQK